MRPAGAANRGAAGAAALWLLDDLSEAEEAVWASLWSSPPAIGLERCGSARVAVRYCRMLAQCEAGPGSATLLVVRQLEDRSGLSPIAMAWLRWVVADPKGDHPTDEASLADQDPAVLGRRRRVSP